MIKVIKCILDGKLIKLMKLTLAIITIISFSSCNFFLNASPANTKLYSAMESRNFEAAKEAIESNADLNTTSATTHTVVSNNDNNTVSFCTVNNYSDDIALYLIEQGANPNYHKNGASLLMSEISLGNYEICKSLIEHGADVNYTFIDGRNTVNMLGYLFKSEFSENDIKIIDLLITSGFEDKDGILNLMLNLNYNEKYNYLFKPQTLNSVSYLINKLYAKQKDSLNISPLMYYLSQGDSEKALEQIEKYQITDNMGSLMIFACAFCNEQVIQSLLDKGGTTDNVCLSDSDGDYNLFDIAVAYNNLDTVKYLQNLGLKPKFDYSSIKMSLINRENPQVFKFIMNNMKNFSLTEAESKQNILYYASNYNRLDFFETVAEHLKELTDETYTCCISYLVNNNSIKILEFFKKQGYENILREAMDSNCNMDTYNWLFNNSANATELSKLGTLAICEQAAYGDKEKIEFLIKNGCDINAKDTIYGNTALFYAIEYGNIELVKYLIGEGADLNLKNNDEETPLICAVNTHSHNIVKLLVENGANISMVNYDGQTPYEIATHCIICNNDSEMKTALALE